MKIERLLEATLDIEDPISFCADPDQLMQMLRLRFEGRCYSRCLIKKIIRVDQKSPVCISSMKTRHTGQISVKFTAIVIVANPGDIIHGCNVVKTDPNVVLGKYKQICVRMDKDNVLANVAAVGQLISVVVKKESYQLNGEVIYAHVEPWRRSAISTYYLVPTVVVGLAESTPMQKAAEIMRKEVAKSQSVKTTNPKGWQVFEQLYYPFTEIVAPPGRILELEKMQLTPGKYVSRCAQLRDDAVFTEVDECPPSDTSVIVATSEQIAVTLMLDYVAYLRAFRKLCTLYNTNELIAQHKMWFAVIKQGKVKV